MPSTRSKTERPRGPLLYVSIGHEHTLRSISGRLRSPGFGQGGAIGEIPLCARLWPNLDSRETGRETVGAG
jgi:hypothetical protein